MHRIHPLHLVHRVARLAEGSEAGALFLENLDDGPSRVGYQKTASRSVKSERRGKGDAVPTQFPALAAARTPRT